MRDTETMLLQQTDFSVIVVFRYLRLPVNDTPNNTIWVNI